MLDIYEFSAVFPSGTEIYSQNVQNNIRSNRRTLGGSLFFDKLLGQLHVKSAISKTRMLELSLTFHRWLLVPSCQGWEPGGASREDHQRRNRGPLQAIAAVLPLEGLLRV